MGLLTWIGPVGILLWLVPANLAHFDLLLQVFIIIKQCYYFSVMNVVNNVNITADYICLTLYDIVLTLKTECVRVHLQYAK